ncbi:MAG TPA: DUF4214 domain-containing protein, partial [Pseudoduganella sp.]
GSDVIYGQGGIDRLSGSDGNDSLNSGEYVLANSQIGTPDNLGDWLDGGAGNDSINGGSGSDFLIGGSGTNSLNGGGGFDTALYSGVRNDFTVAKFADGMPAGVLPMAGGGLNDTLVSVERLSFWDGAIAFDFGHDGNAGKMYRLYQAALDRTPDEEGLGWWINAADKGNSWLDMAKGFMGSTEWADKYGTKTTNEVFVQKLYVNALHRPFDQEGLDFWTHALDNGVSREQILLEFAESDENYAHVIGTIDHGINYKLFTDFGA